MDGRPSKLTRSHDAYLAAEARDGMIPWNGDGENLIDRFDGRALLDMYIDPDPRAKRQKSDGELELEEVCAAAPLYMQRCCCTPVLSCMTSLDDGRGPD